MKCAFSSDAAQRNFLCAPENKSVSKMDVGDKSVCLVAVYYAIARRI